MPLQNYSVLKGRPVNNRLGSSGSPHYQVLVSADGDLYRIAINVQSQDKSEVQYLIRKNFEHPMLDQLAGIEQGLLKLPSKPNGLALDFIRGNIGQPWEFEALPISVAGPDNDLNDKLDAYVQRAMADEHAWIYAFGITWGPEQKADPYFGFKPGQGIHDIHFNQGNPAGKYAADNGPWQDGGLIFQFPGDSGDSSLWVGIFMKFQTQAWHSDDTTGDPVLAADPDHPTEPHTPISRDRIPPLTVPDGIVRIIGALVNDTASPERETVTLLNTADRPVDLSGWAIADKQKHKMSLDGSIGAGQTLTVAVKAPAALSNKGGLITLLNQDGVKVHGVSYTRDQARQPGRTIPFQQ